MENGRIVGVNTILDDHMSCRPRGARARLSLPDLGLADEDREEGGKRREGKAVP